MTTLKYATILPSIFLLGAATALAAPAAASGRVDEGIAHYQAARYVEALQVFDELEADTDGSVLDAADRDLVDQYRALCLLALDRPVEARAVLRRLIERRPEYHLAADELPPRFVAAVRETQAEVLPNLVRSEYRAAKASYDRGAYGDAESRLRRVVHLAEAEGLAAGVRESFADVAELARGFLVLIDSYRVEAVASLPPPAAPAQPARDPAMPYTAADRAVTPPVAVRQELPGWRVPGPGNAFLGSGGKGTLEVVIDEAGRVEAARLLKPLNPVYDAQLLAATKKWQYRPATREGKPVRFRKVMDVRLVDERRN